jgi:cation diffusion facilitator family transporter
VNEDRGEIYLPEDKQKLIAEARRIEFWSLGFLIAIIAVLGFTMSTSQAMKTIWLEDMLSLIPTTAVLVGIYARRWQPDENFNYGYHRTMQIGFLASSVALLGFGLYLIGDSAYSLITAHRSTIQTVELFGTRVWLGWLMIAALVCSIIPPLVLGRIKLKLATELHDKTLYTAAMIDKGDWLSGIAAIVGVVGLAFGYWWADSAAAAFISYEIVHDGWQALKNSTFHLMDMRPTSVDEKEPDEIIEKVQREIEGLAWVRDASLRLREEGDLISGEAFVVPRDEHDLLEKLGQAGQRVKSLDWRIQDFNFIPVSTLETGGNNGEPARS